MSYFNIENKGVDINMNNLASEGFLRLNQIVGNKTTPAIIPISKSSWWAGLKKEDFLNPLSLAREQQFGELRILNR